jgi:hypothetical protein
LKIVKQQRITRVGRLTALERICLVGAKISSKPELPKLFDKMLALGADPNYKEVDGNPDNNSLLIKLVRFDRYDLAKVLVNDRRTLVDYQNKHADTALSLTIKCRGSKDQRAEDVVMLKALLARDDLDPNIGDALAKACIVVRRDIVEILCADERVNPNKAYIYCMNMATPLYFAMQAIYNLSCVDPMVATLLAHHAIKVNVADSDGHTPLDSEVVYGKVANARALLTKWGNTPLDAYSGYKDEEMEKLLKDHGCKTAKELEQQKAAAEAAAPQAKEASRSGSIAEIFAGKVSGVGRFTGRG